MDRKTQHMLGLSIAVMMPFLYPSLTDLIGSRPLAGAILAVGAALGLTLVAKSL